MNPAHDLLDDLVEAVPDHIVPADLAATTWRAGRRRRIRKRIAASTAVTVAAAALLLAAAPVLDEIRSLPPAGGVPGDGTPTGVTSYPERIGHQWWVRDLPDRPGPVAGLVELVKESPNDSKPLGWHVVSPGGHRWQLPADWRTGTTPTISPDGRHVGYLATSDGPYVLHDLVSGERHEFAISAGFTIDDEPTSDAPYALHQQTPSYWSPDRSRVLQSASRVPYDDESLHLILSVDGTVTEFVPRSESFPGFPAGWLSDTEVLFVSPARADPDDWLSPIVSVEATVYGMDGRRLRTVDLVSDIGWNNGPSQWVGGVSPDGTEVAIRDGLDSSLGYYLLRFSVVDGALIEFGLVTLPTDVCGTTWASTRPTATYWDSSYRHLTTGIVEEDSRRPLVTVEPLIGGRCLTWADDAIGGHPRGGMFGTSTAAWTWWWREVLVGLALAAAVGVAALRRRRDSVERWDSAMPRSRSAT